MRDMPINVLKCDCPQIEYSDPNLDQNKTNLLSPCSLANSSYRAFPPKKNDILKAKKEAKFALLKIKTDALSLVCSYYFFYLLFV